MVEHLRSHPHAGRIIQTWRRQCGLTQEELAHRLEVTFSTVSRWENGHVKPSKLACRALKKLADETGTQLQEPSAEEISA